MSIFDITAAGAYVNAIQAANEKDRLEADPHRFARSATKPSRLLSAARTLPQAFLRVMKVTNSLQPAARLRTRTA